jgi:hypothetical protein
MKYLRSQILLQGSGPKAQKDWQDSLVSKNSSLDLFLMCKADSHPSNVSRVWLRAGSLDLF